MTKTKAQKLKAKANASQRGRAAGERGAVPRMRGTSSAPLTKRAQYLQRTPRTVNHGAGVTIHHTEFVGDVDSAIDPGLSSLSPFAISRINLNPAYDAVFQWLSVQASGYEFYQFKKLTFHYIPRTSAIQSGSIMMAPDYDPTDVTPANFQEIMVNPGATDAQVWDHVTVHFDQKALNNFIENGRGYYVAQQTANGTIASDLRLVDSGTLFIATQGVTNSTPSTPTNVGQLFVEYSVEFSLPNSTNRALDKGSFDSPNYPSNVKNPRTTFLSHENALTIPAQGDVDIPLLPGVLNIVDASGLVNATTTPSADFLSSVQNGLESAADVALRIPPGVWRIVWSTAAQWASPASPGDETCLETKIQVSDRSFGVFSDVGKSLYQFRSVGGELDEKRLSTTALIKAVADTYIRFRATNLVSAGTNSIVFPSVSAAQAPQIELTPLGY